MRRVSHPLLSPVAVAFLAAALAFAEPPKVVIPPKLEPTAGYLRFTPETAAKSVVYVSLDDAYPFPSEELKDSRRFLLPVAGLKEGKTYRFVAVASLNDEQSQTPFSYTHGKATTPPPDDPNTPPDQPDDPPATGKLYFVLVRESGPITPAVRSSIVLPAWKEAAAAGHRMKAIEVDKLAKDYADKVKKVPSLVVVRVDGATSTYVKTVDMPTTDADVRNLLK